MSAESAKGTGQGLALKLRRSRMLRSWDWASDVIYALTFITVALLVLLPLGALIYGSFRTNQPGFPGEWTLENWTSLASTGVLNSLANTLMIAAGTAIMSTVGGAVMAWIVCRTDFRYKTIATVLISLTFYFPGFIMAMAWIILGSTEGVFNILLRLVGVESWRVDIYTHLGIIWVMTLHILPFVFLNLRAPLLSMDATLEEAARMSGAGPWRTIRRVTLPLTVYPILSSFLLTFIMSAEQFAIPALIGISSHIHVLSTQLYLLVQFSPPQYGLAAALGLMLSLITGLSIWAQRKIVSRSDLTSISGKNYRPTMAPLGRGRYLAYLIIFGYLLVALVLPAIALLYTSFLKFFSLPQVAWTESGLQVNWDNVQWTLRNYQFIFKSPSTVRAFWNTLYVSAGGAVLGILLGTFSSYYIHKVKPRGYRILDLIGSLPFGVPGIVLGLGFLWAYVQMPLYGTIWIIIMSFITRYLPFATETVSAQMVQLDKSLEEAAWSSGSTRLRGFRRIIFPLIVPSMQSGYFLLFMAFFREISSAIMLYTARTKVISVQIWAFFENADWGYASALSVVSTIIVFVTMMFIQNRLPNARFK